MQLLPATLFGTVPYVVTSQPRDFITTLSEGLAPDFIGTVPQGDFSRPLQPDNKPLYRTVTFKVAGSPVFLPDEFEQFADAVTMAAIAHSKRPDFDYASTRGTLYIRQNLLQPGQYSVAGGVHIDGHVASGREISADVYLVSDQSALTTLYYPEPFQFDKAALSTLPQNAQYEMIKRQLIEQSYDQKPVCGAAFELVRGSDWHVHEARTPQNEALWRTFLYISFQTDNAPNVTANPELLHWQLANKPEDYDFQVRAGTINRARGLDHY